MIGRIAVFGVIAFLLYKNHAWNRYPTTADEMEVKKIAEITCFYKGENDLFIDHRICTVSMAEIYSHLVTPDNTELLDEKIKYDFTCKILDGMKQVATIKKSYYQNTKINSSYGLVKEKTFSEDTPFVKEFNRKIKSYLQRIATKQSGFSIHPGHVGYWNVSYTDNNNKTTFLSKTTGTPVRVSAP